ncbi:hypothetical protein COO60DRAFT_1528769 [Scenedesmus sp. NREL 46B-D3]|nr:hypothetical protein COO60DRAFT_1528769 [Scenedesmus sp. NREL 46B-D3]
MEVPQEALEQLQTVQAAVDELEEHMQPFLEASPKDLTAQLTPLEQVKVNLALAQSVVTLYQLHRRLAAANLDKHPLQRELERLAAYERKVKNAVTADDLARSRPGASLNIAAANRFIDAAIPDLTDEQKRALRTLGKQQQGQAAAAGAGAASAAGSAAAASGSKRRRAEQQQQQHQGVGGSASVVEERSAGSVPKHQQPSSSEGLEGVGAAAAGQQQADQRARKQQKQLRQRQQRAQNPADAAAQEFLQEVMAEMDV